LYAALEGSALDWILLLVITGLTPLLTLIALICLAFAMKVMHGVLEAEFHGIQESRQK
jgi:1,4-dihydroxy-2-naphthoate octaprenyltransferase